MLVAIAVVAQEHDRVLPDTGILVVDVGQGLVGQDLSLLGIAHREPAHGNVWFAAVAIAREQRLAIVQQTEEVFRHIALGAAE